MFLSDIKKNGAISALCKAVSMVVGYLYVPIVLRYLGVEKYGVWSTILTIFSWISYFDIGIGNGLRNRLTESLSKKDGKSRQLVSSAYAFIALITSSVTLVFTYVASKVDWNRFFGVEASEENLKGVIILGFLFVAINFVISICKNILYALQRSASVSVMELLVQITNLLGVLIATKYYESNLFIMTLVYGSSMFLVNLGASVWVYIHHKEVRPNFSYIDISLGRKLGNIGLQFFVIQICALVLYTTDSLIISYLYGASDVTPYSTVNKLFGSITGMYSALIIPIWSAVTKLKAEHQFHQLKKIIRKLHQVLLVFALMTLCLMFCFRPVMKLWLGYELEYSSALITFGGIYCLLNIWGSTYSYIANGLEVIRISMIIALAEAIVNIPLSLFLAEGLGMQSTGVLAGTVLSMLISNTVLPIAVYKKLRSLNKESLP